MLFEIGIKLEMLERPLPLIWVGELSVGELS